ncbi:unnamed protein product [Gordionus sp. m RMFG-2023]
MEFYAANYRPLDGADAGRFQSAFRHCWLAKAMGEVAETLAKMMKASLAILQNCMHKKHEKLNLGMQKWLKKLEAQLCKGRLEISWHAALRKSGALEREQINLAYMYTYFVSIEYI